VNDPISALDRAAALVAEVRQRLAPDPRRAVFEIRVEHADGGLLLQGETTVEEAVRELRRHFAASGAPVVDAVLRLPDAALGDHGHALASAPLVPLYSSPRLPSALVTQLVLGMRVEVLSRDGVWLRVRAEDGYIGWVHQGYLRIGSADWAKTWERGRPGEPVVSLGAELLDGEGTVLARLPWGARAMRRSAVYELPDGATGTIAGEVVDVDRLADRFPARGESIVRSARRWLGAPYLWGGVSPYGVDCSGLTQAVMWMHGIALPRDSDMQAAVPAAADPGTDPAALRPGDLLFFAEPGSRVSHVAISTGGARYIHAAISNGAVAFNDLLGEAPLDRRLASMFVLARRLLPD
jgi:gamma-D-glutamyl-L-lysine dipeptidyl-peptidase